MNPFKAVALCLTLGLSLFSIYLLVQNIQAYSSGFWCLILIFAGFNIWLFLKLLFSTDKIQSDS